MKLPSLFTLFLCLLLRSSAAPIPSEDNGNQLAPSGNLPPLPGRTESHYDPTTGIATAYYGDDRMPEHMGHVQRNQAQRPENRLPMPASENHELEQNRQEALRGILSGGLFRTYAPLLGNRVRDEKHPAMFSNEHHSTTTTVEYLPAKESSMEGVLLKSLKGLMTKHKVLGQIRPNSGWLPLDPHQRIAHEAPARLNSETRDPTKVAKESSGTLKRKRVVEKEEKVKKVYIAGYRPVLPSGMTLRYRKPGTSKPAIPRPPREKLRKPGSETNLQPGREAEVGHFWKPDNIHPSHFGAHVPPTNSHTRQPPRPQNWDHYKKQKEKTEKFNTDHPPAKFSHHNQAQSLNVDVPGRQLDDQAGDQMKDNLSKSHASAKAQKIKQNLAIFNAAHPPPMHHRTAEAPGKVETHRLQRQHSTAPDREPANSHSNHPSHANDVSAGRPRSSSMSVHVDSHGVHGKTQHTSQPTESHTNANTQQGHPNQQKTSQSKPSSSKAQPTRHRANSPGRRRGSNKGKKKGGRK